MIDAAAVDELGDTCVDWVGPDVRSVLCQPKQLADAFSSRQLDEPGDQLLITGRPGADAPGLSQSVGPALQEGAVVRLEDVRAGSRLALRVQVADHTRLLLFRVGAGDDGRYVLKDSDSGAPHLDRDGRRLEASRVLDE